MKSFKSFSSRGFNSILVYFNRLLAFAKIIQARLFNYPNGTNPMSAGNLWKDRLPHVVDLIKRSIN